MEERYANAKAITGTRSYHQFKPLTKESHGMKRLLEQEQFSTTFKSCAVMKNGILKPKVSDLITCVYDAHSWIGIDREIGKQNKDIRVTFLHPPLPSHSLQWSEQEDISYIK